MTLYISKGPEIRKIDMPNVVKQQLASAKADRESLNQQRLA